MSSDEARLCRLFRRCPTRSICPVDGILLGLGIEPDLGRVDGESELFGGPTGDGRSQGRLQVVDLDDLQRVDDDTTPSTAALASN